MKSVFDRIFFYLIFGILLFPVLINLTNVAVEKKLDGAVEVSPDTKITWEGWISGSFQQIKEKYLNDIFFGHNFCVRFHNEIDFRLFGIGHARKVVIGKENYLFEKDYIISYLGKDYLGDKVIDDYTEKLKKAQSYLESRGKTLIVVLAAGKGSFYPEYFPEPYCSMKKSKSNFEEFIVSAESKDINFINYSTYFNSMKDSSPYILYPKYGTHWSIYSMSFVVDSLIHYIEEKRNTRLPHIIKNSIEIKDATDIDYDIGSGMNLLSYLEGPEMAYPNISFENRNGQDSTRLLVVSDSFYWGIYNMGFPNVFSKSHFWYYNNEVYPSLPNFESTDKLNFSNEISNHDVFILMATEHNIPGVGWGFVDKVIDISKSN